MLDCLHLRTRIYVSKMLKQEVGFKFIIKFKSFLSYEEKVNRQYFTNSLKNIIFTYVCVFNL